MTHTHTRSLHSHKSGKKSRKLDSKLPPCQQCRAHVHKDVTFCYECDRHRVGIIFMMHTICVTHSVAGFNRLHAMWPCGNGRDAHSTFVVDPPNNSLILCLPTAARHRSRQTERTRKKQQLISWYFFLVASCHFRAADVCPSTQHPVQMTAQSEREDPLHVAGKMKINLK